MDKKRVYTFGNGQAEGKADMKNLLGGKGANLAEMNLIGIPVPPGFTITTEVCTEYNTLGRDKVVELLKDEVVKAIARVEELMKSKFGDIENPLLVSVRSGARALNEVFYLEDFLQIEKDFPNFTFHLALDRPDPAADAAGVKYTPGFVHNVIYETYLKNHEAPEDIEYYMCGPGPMSKAVEKMLDDLGVPAQNLMFDNFGG